MEILLAIYIIRGSGVVAHGDVIPGTMHPSAATCSIQVAQRVKTKHAVREEGRTFSVGNYIAPAMCTVIEQNSMWP